MSRANAIGLYLIFFGLAFGFATTWYHGWNWRPQSVAECVTDSVSLASAWLGVVLLNKQHTTPTPGVGREQETTPRATRDGKDGEG